MKLKVWKQYFAGTDCRHEDDDGCDDTKAIVSDPIYEQKCILDLPEDIILLLFQYLPPIDIIR